MKKLNQESDVCPVCGNTNLIYDGFYMNSTEEGLHYKWECQECKSKGEKWYELKFTAHLNIIRSCPEIEPPSKPLMSRDFCKGYELSNCCEAPISVESPFCDRCKDHATNKCTDCLDPLCNKRIII